MGYLRCLIGINLVYQCLYGGTNPIVTMRELQEWSGKLYRAQSKSEDLLELYLFFVMLNWNTGETNPKQIQEVICKWKEAYCRKFKNHPNRERPRDVFYLGRGEGLKSIISSSSLRFAVRQEGRRDPFFRDLLTMQVLKRIYGRLMKGGTSVKIEVRYQGHRDEIEINLDRPCLNPLYWNKRVHFFLGFSWNGPKALNVLTDSIEEYNNNMVQIKVQQTQPRPQRSNTRGVPH